MRTRAFQVVRCNRCGNYVFVLPRDVYPQPKPKKKAAPKGASAIRGESTPPPASPGAAPAATSRRNVVAGSAEVAEKAAPAASPASARAVSTSPDSASEVRIDAIELKSRGSLFTPVRVVACAIFGVVVLTGYFVWQSQRKEKAALTLREHLDAGDAAFRALRFDEAAAEYQQAAQAVDILGRDDVESRVVRQKAKELNAIAHLSRLSLYDLCEEARLAVAEGETKWSERFDRNHRDSWVIVEGDIVTDAGPDGTQQPLIRYPFPIDGAAVILDARLKALEPRSAVAGPQRVIFAGQLVSFAEEGTKSKAWVLRLKDTTAFLWTGDETYRALGLGSDALRSDEDTNRLLAAQGEIVGVKP
jgi:hypothetical protein